MRALHAICIAVALAGAAGPAMAADAAPKGLWRATFTVWTTPPSSEGADDGAKGTFTVTVHPEWAPLGADRFWEIIHDGVFDGARFFRVIDEFMAQFGIPADPAKAKKWKPKKIPEDDPVEQSNTRGRISFATSGPRSRTTQVFINFRDNGNLDGMGFAPFGEVTDGMAIVDSLYKGYGEGAPRGNGPQQHRLQTEGEEYLASDFPKLSKIISVEVDASAGDGEL